MQHLWLPDWEESLTVRDVENVVRAYRVAMRKTGVNVTSGEQLLLIVAAGLPTSAWLLRNVISVELRSPIARLLNSHFRCPPLTIHQMDVLRRYSLWDILQLQRAAFPDFLHVATLLQAHNVPHAFNDVTRLAKQGTSSVNQMTPRQLQKAVRPDPVVTSQRERKAAEEDNPGYIILPSLYQFTAIRGKRLVRGELNYFIAWEDGEPTLTPRRAAVTEANRETFDNFDARYRYMHGRVPAFDVGTRTRPTASARRQQARHSVDFAALRKSVIEYQGRTCGYRLACTAPYALSVARSTDLDHINEDPGDNRRCNLVACCKSCHGSKTALYRNRQDYILRAAVTRLSVLRHSWNKTALSEQISDAAPLVWLENPAQGQLDTNKLAYSPVAETELLRRIYRQQLNKCRAYQHLRPPRTPPAALPALLSRSTVGSSAPIRITKGFSFVQHFSIGRRVQGFRATVTGLVTPTARIAYHRQWMVDYDDATTGSMTLEEILPYVCQSFVTRLDVGMFVTSCGPEGASRITRGQVYPSVAPEPWEQRFTGMIVTQSLDVIYETGETRRLSTFEAKLQRCRFMALNTDETEDWQPFCLPPAVYQRALRSL